MHGAGTRTVHGHGPAAAQHSEGTHALHRPQPAAAQHSGATHAAHRRKPAVARHSDGTHVLHRRNPRRRGTATQAVRIRSVLRSSLPALARSDARCPVRTSHNDPSTPDSGTGPAPSRRTDEQIEPRVRVRAAAEARTAVATTKAALKTASKTSGASRCAVTEDPDARVDRHGDDQMEPSSEATSVPAESAPKPPLRTRHPTAMSLPGSNTIIHEFGCVPAMPWSAVPVFA